MRGTTRKVLVAAVSATALLAAGCGGGESGGGSGGGGGSEAPGKAGGAIVVEGCNPENPLIPGNTTETCGGNVLDIASSRLVHYNAEDAAPENDIAESIETTDNQNFTVKIKKGYKFQDGTEVLAKNFVDAWNYVAFGPNAQSSSYFMEPIEGFADVNAEKSTVKELSGLKVVDDHTFTIKTTDKVSNLPVRLGYTAFAPLPDVFFKDPDAFGEKPILSGPYQVTAWNKNQDIVLEKFKDYSGDFGGQADKITFKIYQDDNAAYTDLLANNLDVVSAIPATALTGDKYKTDLPDRNTSRETGVIQTITANSKVDPAYTPDVMKAISMGIDRDTINKQIFNGTRVPATGWVSPVVDGYKADACGEYCVYDPAKAKAQLEKAGGFKDPKITLSYNGDGGHKEWTEAACNSIKQALGVDCVATPVVDFKTFRTQIGKREMKGLFRTGWQMDYPSIENFLAPIFATGASSNDGDYSNPKFDAKLKEAAAAPTLEEANKLYQEAEGILAQDFPSIPLFYGRATIGWSENVSNVKLTAFGVPDFRSITAK